MRIVRIKARELPGIPDSFELDNLDNDINIILGPNGSGKSSIRRLVENIFWPLLKASAGRYAEIVFKDGGKKRLTAKITGDRIAWDENGISSSAPDLPERHLRSCFFLDLRDLLSDDRLDRDDPLLQEIRRGLSGFDREAVARRYAIRPREGKNELEALKRAKGDLSEIKRRYEILASEEDRLESLYEELERAKNAKLRLDSLKALKRVVAANDEIAELAAELKTFPERLEVLRDKDLDDLMALDKEILDTEKEVETLSAKIAEITGRLDGVSEIPEPPPSDEILKARIKSADKLLAKTEVLEKTAEALAADNGKLLFVAESLGITLSDAESIKRKTTLKSLADLARAADERGDALLSVKKAELELEKLGPSSGADEGEGGETVVGPSSKRGMADALRDWLAISAESAPASEKSGSRVVWFVVGAVLLIAGGGLSFASSWFVALAGLGLGVLTVPMASAVSASRRMRTPTRDPDVEREEVRREYERLADEDGGVSEWNRDSVKTRLESLEAEIAEILLRQERARDLDSRIEIAVATLKTERKKLEEIEACLETELKSLGFDLPASGLEPRLLVDRLKEVFTAASEVDARIAEADKQREVRDGLMDDLNAFLEESGRSASDDPALLEVEINRLNDDVQSRRTTLEKLADAEKDLKRAERNLEKVLGKRADMLKKLSLPEEGAEAELRDRIGRLPEFDTLSRRERGLEGQVSVDMRNLTPEDRARVEDAAPGDIDAEILEREAETAKHDDIIKETERIKNDIKLVASKSEIGEKTALLELAEEALREKCGQIIRKAAAETLLGLVEDEYQRENRPKVLNVASELFESFTKGLYKLSVATASHSLEIVALNSADQKTYSLDKLSDGTRIQLLLAVKTAFSDNVDPNRTGPLFLDEPLTTSDPERFRAAATALAEISVDRQIFYLSSNPGDEDRWFAATKDAGRPEPNVVDLAAARSLGAKLVDIAELAPPQSVPKPDGMTPVEYAVAIGAEKINLREPATSWHIFYAAMPDTELCHKILDEYQVDTIGQWLTISCGRNAVSVERNIGKDDVERLNAKARLLETIRAFLIVGHGSPFTGLDAANCPAIKGTYRDALIAIAEECGVDARKFLEVI
ncbi:MAG: hypothetical protein GXP32_06460, partial [Kiritimatiellaeota bacterium]|nr:hypothetical protein [Kiritimatiellota bacterium]